MATTGAWADPDICNKGHTTPLHAASSRGSLEAARLLLSHGAKVDVKDKKGRTPLQVAASNVRDELTKLLVEHGAVPPSQSLCKCVSHRTTESSHTEYLHPLCYPSREPWHAQRLTAGVTRPKLRKLSIILTPTSFNEPVYV